MVRLRYRGKQALGSESEMTLDVLVRMCYKVDMDFWTRQGLITAASVMLAPLFISALRKYRPTKFAHDYLWRRVKSPRLRAILFKDV